MLKFKWARSKTRRRIMTLVMAVAIAFGGVTAVSVRNAAPAKADATHQIEIGMPFAGQWAYNANVNPPYTDANSSHPSVHHTPGGGDWATDVYAAEGTAVKLEVGNATGAVTYSWGSSSTSCGQSTKINVFVGGVNVGWLYFAHLNNVVTSGAITNGMTLGTVKTWYASDGSVCNPGTHVHIEFKNTTNYACYVDNGHPGVTLNQGDGLGVLGSTNAGAQQACASVPGGRPSPTSNVGWNFTTLEGDSGSVSKLDSNVGMQPTTVIYNNTLHAFYYDQQNRVLRHAWLSGSTWYFETLDGAGGSNGRVAADVGVNPSVTVYGDSIQLFYYNAAGKTLRHAWASSTVPWNFENLDGDAGSVAHQTGDVGSASRVVTYGNTLQVFYPNLTNGDLRHAWADANGWHFENLDGDAGSIAGMSGNYGRSVGTSLGAWSSSTSMQLFYYDANVQALRHAWVDANGWHFERLDGGAGSSISGRTDSVGQNPSVTYNGALQVFYYNATKGDLSHAWSDANGWHFEELDGPGSAIGPDLFSVGQYSGAVSNGSNIQLFYYDNQYGELRHAWSDSSGWHFENLDGLGGQPTGRVTGNVGKFPSLTIYNYVIYGFYYDVSQGNLRLATSR
ncbi:MAG: hypothetical protein ACJ786_33300 [Catenulispora sp.]